MEETNMNLEGHLYLKDITAAKKYFGILILIKEVFEKAA